VVFVRDACRNPLDKLRLSFTGSLIFPSAGIPQAVQVDQVYATASGDSAYGKIPGGRRLEAFGSFTRTLKSGLAGGSGASARLIRDTCPG
jgi:hypothetical protein